MNSTVTIHPAVRPMNPPLAHTKRSAPLSPEEPADALDLSTSPKRHRTEVASPNTHANSPVLITQKDAFASTPFEHADLRDILNERRARRAAEHSSENHLRQLITTRIPSLVSAFVTPIEPDTCHGFPNQCHVTPTPSNFVTSLVAKSLMPLKCSVKRSHGDSRLMNEMGSGDGPSESKRQRIEEVPLDLSIKKVPRESSSKRRLLNQSSSRWPTMSSVNGGQFIPFSKKSSDVDAIERLICAFQALTLRGLL